MKKLLLLVMSLALVLGMVTVPAVAADEVIKLTWAQGTGSDAPPDVALVNEALNEISRERLGVEVDIMYFTNDVLLAKTAAGELFDMYFTCDWYNNFTTNVLQTGLFAEISEQLKTVTPDLYATMTEDVWELSKINGGIYAIPVKKDYAPEIFIVYDKDFYDSIGVQLPDTMDKLAELTPYIEMYVEHHDSYPLQMGGTYGGIDGVFNFINRNSLIGFNYNLAGTEEGRKIVSVYEDEQMLERLHTFRDWYLAGYTDPDAATKTEDSLDSKINYFKFVQCWDGYDGYDYSYGYKTGLIRISGPYLSVSGVQGSMNALCVTLEDDPARLEAALRYQELVNTDLTYRDMLRYGVEGTHFNYREDGAVLRTTLGSDRYSPWAFSQGSYQLSSIMAASETAPVNFDQWDQYFSVVETQAIVAEDVGFAFDPTPVEIEIAAINAIDANYRNIIFSGTVDTDEYVAKVLSDMEAAGLSAVKAEAQAQFDAFKAR